MTRVIITGPAKRDIQVGHDWWAEHRSVEQAARWYRGVHAAIKSLERHPERCSATVENDLFKEDIRQLLYGLGRRPSHRIVFTIDGDIVIVLRIRHVSQDTLTTDDIGS
jgi:plasmid stabilization system protein ParE